jgi:hypothetical protein
MQEQVVPQLSLSWDKLSRSSTNNASPSPRSPIESSRLWLAVKATEQPLLLFQRLCSGRGQQPLMPSPTNPPGRTGERRDRAA